MSIASEAIEALHEAADAYNNKIAEINSRMEEAEADYQSKLVSLTTLKYAHRDTADRSYGADWGDGLTTDWWSMRGGVSLELTLSILFRNDSSSWGGAYTEVLYDLGDGWVSLGQSGFDGPMINGASAIPTYTRCMLIPALSEDNYDVRFLLRHKSYDGTLQVNASRNFSGEHFGSLLQVIC